MTEEPKRKTSIFEFHTGYRAEQHGEQFIMDCPFCEKENKFYFTDNNLWDCKSGPCTAHKMSGNQYEFIRKLYDKFDNATVTAQDIATIRGLPRDVVAQFGIKYNHINNSYLIPTRKNGKIYNLYKAVEKRVFVESTNTYVDKFTIMASPSIEHMLMDWPETSEDELWVVEGHWDRIAAQAIIGSNKPITITSVPGAGVWKPSWCEVLAEKNVVFIYDNDQKGMAGFERVILKEIAHSKWKPKSIRYMSWPDGTPPGYDLNDLYRDKHRASYGYIQQNLKPYSAPENTVVVKSTIETIAPDKSCNSFNELISRFKENYHVTPDMEMCLACLLASVYSIKIDGEQLWYKVIGPPGSGKTTIAKMMSSSDQVVLKSTFTGLFSGWKDDSGEDASMVPLISNKMLVVKDADALLRQPNVERIFSELRDFYDKDSSTQYKNKVANDYRNIRSTMVLCGTNALRRADSNFLGERFLDFELRLTRDDEDKIKMKMMEKAERYAFSDDTSPADTPLLASAKGFIDFHLLDRKVETKMSDKTRKLIWDVATLVAKLRTKVDRDTMGKGEVTFAPTTEVPSRLMGQLVKQAICLPVVTGDDRFVDASIKKVCTDILDLTSRRHKICQILMEGYFNIQSISENTGYRPETTARELDDLRHLNLLDIEMRRISPVKKQAFMTLREEIKDSMIKLGI